MKNELLTIGNIIKYKDEIFTISKVTADMVEITNATKTLDVKIADIKGMAITKEWLEKLGFDEIDKFGYEKTSHTTYCKSIRYEISVRAFFNNDEFNDITVVFNDCPDGWSAREFKHVKYVHQVQNLVYVLLGEKLEIEL